MSRLRRLDHAVGVEQQRVAAAGRRPATHGNSASSIRPEHRPLGLEHRPAAGAGGAAARPAGGRRCGSRSRRWPGRARGGWRWRTPRPSPGAAGSRWRPAGTPPAAARVSRPPKAPESSSARVPACSPLPETSTTTTSSRSPSWRAGDDEVAGERRAARRPQRGLGVPAVGQRRDAALAAGSGRAGRPASTRPCAPATPSRERRNDVSRMMKPSSEDDRDASSTMRGRDRRLLGERPPSSSTSTKTTNHGSCARAEQQAAEQQRQHQRGDRDDARASATIAADEHQREQATSSDQRSVLRAGAAAQRPGASCGGRREVAGRAGPARAERSSVVGPRPRGGRVTVRPGTGTCAGTGDTRTGCVPAAPRSGPWSRTRGTAGPSRR